MRFFIDTAKVEDIKKANDMGVICGVTTNPDTFAIPPFTKMSYAVCKTLIKTLSALLLLL